jgi:hypothetical protein
MYVCVYIYVCIYICMYVYISLFYICHINIYRYIYIYIYIQKFLGDDGDYPQSESTEINETDDLRTRAMQLAKFDQSLKNIGS